VANAQYIDYFCHFDEPLKRHLVCSAFYFARAKGEIVQNTGDGYWEIPADQPRRMGWKARYFARERNQDFTDHSGDPYAWFACPWCGGDLPPVGRG
jgi:hypothetical protein